MWVGIAPLQCTIECRCGRMHTRHAPLTLMAKNRFPQHFSQSYLWMITKLGMWVGIATLLNPINCRSGRMHRAHAPLTLIAKRLEAEVSAAFIDGWSPNLACGLVLPPFWTLLFTAIPVECTRHAWVSLGYINLVLAVFHQVFHGYYLIFF